MNRAVNILRQADIWVSTQKAAIMLGKSKRWVQLNKSELEFKRKGTRDLMFELSSVLVLEMKLKSIKDAA